MSMKKHEYESVLLCIYTGLPYLDEVLTFESNCHHHLEPLIFKGFFLFVRDQGYTARGVHFSM